MNQQPDKFFREKLSNYERTVSPDAWKRVSQNVRRKSQVSFFLRAAAAVSLLITASIFLYPALQSDRDQLVSENNNKPPVPKEEPITEAPVSPKIESPTPVTDSTTDVNHNAKPKRDDVEKPARRKVVPKQEDVTPPPVRVQHDTQLAMEEPVDSHSTEVVAEGKHDNLVASARPEVQKKKSVTIVFTTEEVNEKYLAKSVNAEATTDDEQSSGLKKLLDKAQDLTQNQDLLGSLRQKKNEILAMNFKSEKELTQND